MAEYRMPDINIVMIVGNLTKDPVLRKTTNGTPVTNFFIASNRRFRDNTGQWREDVCYVGIVAWYKLAESCYEYLQKGSAVLVDGELQSRNLRSVDGVSRNVVEIKARRIQFLDKNIQQEDNSEDQTDNEEYISILDQDQDKVDGHSQNGKIDENDEVEISYKKLKL